MSADKRYEERECKEKKQHEKLDLEEKHAVGELKTGGGSEVTAEKEESDEADASDCEETRLRA